MKQEDFNSMMRHPWDSYQAKKGDIPKCPSCGYNYCGDGKAICTECSAQNS